MEEVRQRARPYRMAFYGANTCWWTSSEEDLYTHETGLPCDPRGGMLFQSAEGELDKFIKEAEAHPERYGKHGIRVFLASYHGVVVTEDGKPTCFDNWNMYNDLLDIYDKEKNEPYF